LSRDTNRAWQFKCVLIGDGNVGKTSIRRKYMGEGFVTSHLATIGVDFAKKVIVRDGAKVWVVIWDLAGQPSYESVRRHYYAGCHSIILVYSVMDRTSFDNASKWLVEAHKYMGKLPPTAVLANKIDLREAHPSDEAVSTEEGRRFAGIFSERLEVPVIYKETSALTGENIQETFHDLIELMIMLNPV
jgi:small GTP-binding protein